MENETKDIKIPIKAIVEQAMMQNGAKYEEDEFNLLRKYFIACLNLGYLKPNDLVTMVNKFAQKIKFIILNYNNVNKLDYYMINQGVLYISGALKDNNFDFYQINFYKAVTEVIFSANDNLIGLSSAICNITAEKIFNMDVNGSRIILPKTDEEMIGNTKIKVRCGYMNYNLIISLTKQLFLSIDVNENKLISEMYFNGFDNVISPVISDSNIKLLSEVLNKLTIMYINRKTKNISNENEMSLIEKYQIIINDSFKKPDQNYFAFLALVTTDELREKCMNKFKM